MGYFCVTTPVKFSEKFTTSCEILGTFYDKIALKTHLDRSPCHPPDKTNWQEYGRLSQQDRLPNVVFSAPSPKEMFDHES